MSKREIVLNALFEDFQRLMYPLSAMILCRKKSLTAVWLSCAMGMSANRRFYYPRLTTYSRIGPNWK